MNANLSVTVNHNMHSLSKYLGKQACVNNVHPDQMLQNVASDKGLHCLPFIQQSSDKSLISKNRFVQILGQEPLQLLDNSADDTLVIFFLIFLESKI